MQIDDCSVHFSYEGDMAEVSQWIPKAKQVFRWMRKQGLTNHYQKVSDTTEIFVQYLPPRLGRIAIKTSNLIFDSGRTELSNSHPLLNKEDQLTYLHKRSPKKAGITDISFDDLGKICGKNLVYGSNKSDPNLTPEERTAYAFLETNGLLHKRSGLYTGLMREAVQTQIGLGKKVYYDYHFSRSHGIIRTSNDTLWIVEISNDNGVIARKARLLSTSGPLAPKTVTDELLRHSRIKSIIAPEQDDNFMKRDGDWIQLLPASEMNAQIFGDKSPWFSECGWAFSYSKLEAQNTCVKISDPDLIYTGYRYKINFHENKEGNLSFATLNLIESGIIWGELFTGLKYPIYQFGIMGSVDWSGINISLSTNPSPETDMAVYVFYDDDNEVIGRHKNPGMISTQLGPGFPPYADPLHGNTPQYVGYWYNGTKQNWSPEDNYIDGMPTTVSGITNGQIGPTQIMVVKEKSWGTYCYTFSPGDNRVFEGSGRMDYIMTTTSGALSTVAQASLLVPFHDREALYCYSKYVEAVSDLYDYRHVNYCYGTGKISSQGYDSMTSEMVVIAIIPDDPLFSNHVNIPVTTGMTYSETINYRYGVNYNPYDGPALVDETLPATSNYNLSGNSMIQFKASLKEPITIENIAPFEEGPSRYFLTLQPNDFPFIMISTRDAFTGRGLASNYPNEHTLSLLNQPYPNEIMITHDCFVGVPYSI